MRVLELEKLVESGEIRSYEFENREDVPGCPYQQLGITFPSGRRIVVVPECRTFDTESGRVVHERLGLYFDSLGR